ncbi:MAG: hypothetical protein ACXACP_13500, partial [Candidatus Hodarchaeales archaeon]
MPFEIYDMPFGQLSPGSKCKLDAISGSDVCLLHLPDPDKNLTQVIQVLINAMRDYSIAFRKEGLHYTFPKGFSFYNLIKASSIQGRYLKALSLNNCLFFANPFAQIERVYEDPFYRKNSIKLDFSLDGSIFAYDSISINILKQYDLNIHAPRSKYITIKFNGTNYPQTNKPCLNISGGSIGSKVLITGIRVEGHLSLSNIGCKIHIGNIDTRHTKTDETELENLSLSGEITTPIEMRFIKVNQRFSIESAYFFKNVLLEHIQNKIFVANRCYFNEAKNSLIRDVNFSSGLFYNTNLFEIPLKEIQWANKPIHYFDNLPILFEDVLKRDNKETEKNLQKEVYRDYHERTWKELEDMYRALKLNYQKQGDSIQASNFHYREMVCKWKQRGLISRLIHWESIYGHFSCWGNSVFRSVFVFLLFIFTWSLFYNLTCLFELSSNFKNQVISLDYNYIYSLTFSIENSFFLRPDFLKPTSWKGELIKSSHSVLSAIQI